LLQIKRKGERKGKTRRCAPARKINAQVIRQRRKRPLEEGKRGEGLVRARGEGCAQGEAVFEAPEKGLGFGIKGLGLMCRGGRGFFISPGRGVSEKGRVRRLKKGGERLG